MGGRPGPLDPDAFTGIERCDNGVLHRPAPVACSSRLPRPLPPANDAGAAADASGALTQVGYLYGDAVDRFTLHLCQSDADCTERPNGYCALAFDGLGPAQFTHSVRCHYGCLQDADCSDGYFCECGDPVGQCVPADCRSDADCGSGLLCAALIEEGPCSSEVRYSCQSASDECNSNADCPEAEQAFHKFECLAEGGRRHCVDRAQAVCGRPFLVEGTARLAELRAGDDWAQSAARHEPAALTTVERDLAAEHWARNALMEHASIAAFARFTLQLLHLGAPRELIEHSQQAMLDETAHAKACFALASRYLGSPVEPGCLALDAALDERELEAIAISTFREGCVGETVAALEAREALDRATDPEVRDALQRIAVDEQRHAELAWRFVSWALGQSPHLRPLLDRELSRLEGERFASTTSAPEADCPEHGVLSEQQRMLLRRSAVAEVVEPCLRQVLALPPVPALDALA
jgi:hypothetical protein